jgi:hypothetical protein
MYKNLYNHDKVMYSPWEDWEGIAKQVAVRVCWVEDLAALQEGVGYMEMGGSICRF